MTLRDALDDYKLDDAESPIFPGERRSTSGCFSGRDGRLVHVARDGSLRDYGYPLTGLNGLVRSRFGVRLGDDVTWFDDCPTRSQRYHDDTALVVTEHTVPTDCADTLATGDQRVVTQYDLTVGDGHVTHFEVGDDAELVAFLGFAPEARETRIGQLSHEGAVELFHADEHDFVGSDADGAEFCGEVPASFEELLSEEPVEFPRNATGGRYEESQLSGNLVCNLPAADGTTTLVTLLTDRDDRSRSEALTRVAELTETHSTVSDLERTAEAQTPDVIDASVPYEAAATADLRVLDLLSAETGLRMAAPDFDPFYAYSGGYGYTWFRDDAEISAFCFEADQRFDLELDDRHAKVAKMYCEIQRSDGTWPHRVWPRDGTLAPGWANGRLEAGDDLDYQADQTASVVTFLGTYFPAVEDENLGSRIRRALDRAMDGLDDTLADDGRPIACQNAWEDMNGRFTHTAATFLEAYATLAQHGPSAAVRERAGERAERVYDALDDLWVPERGIYALRETDGELDDRCDSATFALASAHRAYAEYGELDDQRVERLCSHVRTVANALDRNVGTVRGLVRYEGDDWRQNGQDGEKIWTVSTAWGANAAANVAVILADRDDDAAEFETLARDLLSLVLPGGDLCESSSYLPEQFFDDGTPDSATPLGWPHALRLATVALLEEYEMLQTPVTEKQ
ncbi:glycoside hydrolase family 15 protein [Halorussus halophilus]|uniref:glycoside hydrolase family 15 protein n=1 Tax=Halorussus halophilus TaxID=2650975 RepID=UPI001300EECF|nr:glycoside hydrolase family 15 protein [Halorussus halophilus]